MEKELWAEEYVSKVRLSAECIQGDIEKKRKGFVPRCAVTLGSGLAGLAEQIDVAYSVPYERIPHFPSLTVKGHAGKLIAGYLAGVPVICLSGRKHYYEVAHRGHEGMMEVIFPVHVMASFGVKLYISTNAVGGLNPGYAVGGMMVVKDHFNFSMPDPLVGPELNFGNNLYFQPQHTEYNKELRAMMKDAARCVNEDAYMYEGVYAAMTGRTFETAATSRALRKLGADVVGMSLTPEVITATNRGMDTLAVSLVTNVVQYDGTNPASHEEVLAVLHSEKVRKRLSNTFRAFFEDYGTNVL